MKQFQEAPNNPFDAPVPGQSLTDKPGNSAWEHPPQFTSTDEASEFVWDKLTQPDFAEQVIAMLDAGIPVEAIGRIIVFSGFTEGKWSPDVAFLITEPIMKMIATIGITGGVNKFRISMQDLTNKKEINSILDLNKKKSEFEKASKGLQEDIKQMPEQKGLMAQPQPQEKEMV
tara:strand:- start:5757 stop:6275 length:519 start_codon:yes stop_codon:yes gene_type:complete